MSLEAVERIHESTRDNRIDSVVHAVGLRDRFNGIYNVLGAHVAGHYLRRGIDVSTVLRKAGISADPSEVADDITKLRGEIESSDVHLSGIGLCIDSSRLPPPIELESLESKDDEDDEDENQIITEARQAAIEEHPQEPPDVQFDLTDARRFLSFLSELEPSYLNKNEELRIALESIASSFSNQLVFNYDLNNPDDRVIELLGHASEITAQYERLGLMEAAGRFEQYTQHAHQGNLKEFMSLSAADGLRSTEGWGPATWHFDSTPERYEDRWVTLEEAIRQSLKNENALGLAQQALVHAIKSGEQAITFMEKQLPKEPSDSSRAKAWPELLTIARRHMAELESLRSKVK